MERFKKILLLSGLVIIAIVFVIDALRPDPARAKNLQDLEAARRAKDEKSKLKNLDNDTEKLNDSEGK